MKNKFLVAAAALFWCVQLSWAQGVARPAAVRTASAAGIPAVNPALFNGMAAPAADSVSGLPTLSPAIPSLPSLSVESHPDSFLIGVSNAAELLYAAPAALGSAKDLAEAVAPNPAGEAKSAEQMQGASRQFFDRNLASPADDDVDASAEAAAASVGSAGAGLAESAGASHLGNLYPRVVFIQDVFKGPAPKSVAASIEKLLNEGVRVVFMTWRSAKGAGSADEVLLNQLKFRQTNPVIVVSRNGAVVTPHSRAAHPRPIIADAPAFRAEHLAAFEAAVAKVEAKLGLSKGSIGRVLDAGAEASYSYSLELPSTVSDADAPAKLAEMVRTYNQYLKAARLPYAMTAHPSNPRAAIAFAMPLRFGVPRIFEALKARFPEDRVAESSSKFLVLADTRNSPKLATSFPKESEIQAVNSDAGVEDVLGAVLGERSLPTVGVKLAKLRQFVEYWEPVHRLSLSDGPSRSGSGGMKGGSPVDQKLAMYTGTVIYQMMAYIYDQMWQGQHNSVTLSVLQAKLRSMWYLPFKNGVNVNKGLAGAMKTQAWKARQRGYLEKANAYLTNFYLREFGDYAKGSRNVQENLVGLSSFRSSLVTLEFESSATGKLYKIFTRIPRVMKQDTAMGRVLTAYSYRTGKESPDDGEALLAQTLAITLLKGYGRIGPDGKWHHGAADGPVLAEVRVQLEYMTSHRTVTFKPEQLLRTVAGSKADEFDIIQGPVAQTITSAIERMEADAEYQKYYEEHEEAASAKDAAKKKPASKKAAAKKASAKKAVKKPASEESRRKA
ncbi:MAG: hypothetical protein HZB91_01010 [Elusimicrobia bacterium]|nr:hypothetical protein [Elusimicrobiota bacterium]